MKTLVLVDTNNIGFMSMNDSVPILSFITRVSEYRNKFPNTEICYLNDGRSWRRDIYPEYKANRTVTEKQIAAREAYFEAKKGMMKALDLLGCRQVSAQNMEADDLAALMSASWKRGQVVLISRDKDWNQLVDENTSHYDPYNREFLTAENFFEKTGYRNTKQFVEAKCVLGDAGDNIKGIYRVGPKALGGVYRLYGSFYNFLKIIETSDKEFYRWKAVNGGLIPKALREIDIEQAKSIIRRNKILMDLRTPSRPQIQGLLQSRPSLDKLSFLQFCKENSFRRILQNFDEFVAPFEGK